MLLVWLGFIAFASFYAPFFLSQTPVFKVKEVSVYGTSKIDPQAVREAVFDLSENILALREENLKEVLRSRFGDRVKKVSLKRDFSLNGTSVSVEVKEREPVAKLKTGNSYLLIDPEGVIFKPIGEEGSKLVEIVAYDLDNLSAYFPNLYRYVLSLKLPVEAVKVMRDKVVLHIKDKVVLLPPLELMSKSVSARLEMIYNFPERKVDLRYGRFILVR
ncbi:MAG: hypothetical protein GXO18_05775 [Aquificae bacterium]|nr:hypothetical protein [Aquificota bacterium]